MCVWDGGGEDIYVYLFLGELSTCREQKVVRLSLMCPISEYVILFLMYANLDKQYKPICREQEFNIAFIAFHNNMSILT